MIWKIPLSKPDVKESDKKEVLKVLKTPYLSLGPKLAEFEKAIAKFAGVKYALGVSSGTAGLHLIIRALGIGRNDEVITTPFSFISSANCFVYEGARPVFVDIDEKTLNIDVGKIEEKITARTKAILAVDVFGQPADWPRLEAIAKKHKLFLVEDSAEALGSVCQGKKCGSFGDAAIFSFYPNKQISTGEGGMILTDKKEIADFCRSSTNQGRRSAGPQWLEHVRLGYNYRLDEMSAALGLSQLKRIEAVIRQREKIADLYNKKLNKTAGIEVFKVGSGVSRFVYIVKLAQGLNRDKIISELAKKGIQCSNYFQPIHLQPFYQKEFGFKAGLFPIAEDAGRRTLALPFFNNLSEKEIDFVVSCLKKIIR